MRAHARAVAVAAPAVEDAPAGRGVVSAERIVVRAPNWLGDVVLSLPAVRDLRRNFPAARIEVLARPWVADAVRRRDRGGRGARERAARGRRGRRPRRVRRRRAAPQLVRLRAGPAPRGDPRALGLRHRRPRPAAHARCARPGRGPGPQPGVLLSGDAGGGRSARHRDTRRGPPLPPANGPRRRTRLLGGPGRGSASTPAPSSAAPSAGSRSGTRRWATGWRAAPARGWPSWAGRRSGRWARPSPPACAHPAQILCGRDDPGRDGGRAGPRWRCVVTNDSGPMHVAAALGRARGRRLRPHRRARDGAGGRRPPDRPRAGPLLALRPARVPDRPSLHDAHRRGPAWPPRPRKRSPGDGRPAPKGDLHRPRRDALATRSATSTTSRASGCSRSRWTPSAW